jgi:hypothetical protein
MTLKLAGLKPSWLQMGGLTGGIQVRLACYLANEPNPEL